MPTNPNTTNPYNLGAVVVSSQPEVAFYAQLMAKQQAKRDALDQYYSKALADVTPTGMRNKDVTGGWGQKVSDWQTKYMNPEKRKYLLNPRLDNYRTVTDFNREHQDLLNDAEKSKQLLKKETFINQQRANAKRAFTDDDVNIMDRISKSIYDPTRLDEMGNEPDETQLSINQPEFTPLQEKQMFQGATQGLTKSKIPLNDKTYKKEGFIYTPFVKQFNPNQIKSITDSYSSNLTKSALTHYEQLMHDQDIYDAATKAYQNVYGKDQLIDTPQKMAKGVAAIHALSETETGEDKVPDLTLAQQRRQSNIYLNASLQGKGGSSVTVNDVITPEGNTDLTKLLQGINVNNIVTGKAFKSDKTIYNPRTKEITYHDVVDNQDYTVPASKYRQIINTINTVQDLKVFDNLIEGIDKAYAPPKASGKTTTKSLGNWKDRAKKIN